MFLKKNFSDAQMPVYQPNNATRKFTEESNLATPKQKPGHGDHVFKNGPNKICGTQPLKNLR